VIAHHDLSDATAEEIDGLKHACIEIGEQVAASLENSANPRRAFRSAVISECDKWVENTGQSAYGGGYGNTMRENFYGVVLQALGDAFAVAFDEAKLKKRPLHISGSTNSRR